MAEILQENKIQIKKTDLNILIVNSYDRGGAANACLRLHQGLLNIGVNSKVLLKEQQNYTIPHTYLCPQKIEKPSKIKAIAIKFTKVFHKLQFKSSQTKLSTEALFLKNRAPGLELFSFPTANYDITATQLYKEADIIHLHWVADFLDYKSFFESNTKPVVWTLHDMNPFTGGEHYEERFLGIDASGNPIPRIVSATEIAISKKIINFKTRLFKCIDHLTLVAPSAWLAHKAQQSAVFKGKEIRHIPYGLDASVFTPHDKHKARAVFKISQDKTVILFVAESLINHRKGFGYLKKAFEQLQTKDLVLCAIGHTHEVMPDLPNLIALGNITDDHLMSMAYSAADVYVIPSIMDNLPNTVLESLMCGTPVIGFPVGGITDMIEHGVNGLITQDLSVASLVDSIEHFLNGEVAFDSETIRNNAEKAYDLKVQAGHYLDLYCKLLSHNH